MLLTSEEFMDQFEVVTELRAIRRLMETLIANLSAIRVTVPVNLDGRQVAQGAYNLVPKKRDDGGMTDAEIVARMEEFIFRVTGERLNLTGEGQVAS